MSNCKNMRAKIHSALNDQNLRGALGRFADAYLGARAKAYQGRDFEKLRQTIADRKGSSAQRMEELAQQFKKNAEARGAKVFIARTAEEAKKYILDVALANQVELVVKSKSMASEEIHLNHYLAEHGITAAETDLGEWIIQLAGQRPSHMVMPAIHMTRQEVSEYFSKETNQNLSDDIPLLVQVARQELREKFLKAGMGISGANAAVAETGTIVIVTNEGNARLTTTLPPVHVALVGMEKLVEKFTDVGAVLECLPRSATGQHLTSYVTMITGPTPSNLPDGTIGPKEMHIVLMDNGRTKMKEDPLFSQALQCIRCASCLNVCPIFALVGGHVYGSVYTGGIGTILTAFFNDFDDAGELQNLCLGCERCKEVCPGKIDIPKLILELRNRVTAKKGMPASQKFLLNTVLPNRKLFHSMLKIGSKTQKPFVSDNKIRHLPLFLAGLTEGRSLPALADQPFRDQLYRLSKPKQPKAKVGFFGGCLVDFVYPELGKAANKVLNNMNMEMVYPLEQACCGVPAGHLGATEAHRRMAKQNIEAFEKAGVDYIVTVCPTCTASLKKEFVELLKDDPAWAKRAEDFAAKVYDFIHFVAKQTDNGKQLGLKPLGKESVTYHDSCHMRRNLGIYEEPRKLISEAGLELKEMQWPDRCCGFGGSYSIRYPELSQPILEAKLDDISSTGADILCTACPGCMMQIGGGLDKRNSNIKTKHVVELLAERLPD
ncbi:iron-sulfur cluster protein [Desulfohalotomaculum tongense]|uniref:L-lactate dehydrogenase (quinone) large subunit LdhH n=1 Tax=Desulforadius tongensis TaxID=1216062 RepID=UPI00195C30D8|nr:LUD domain-containing protein [Desulforadius tongensis]MBM7855030.1 iron-sulfur cluster protein [Desulforadius tongensis]